METTKNITAENKAKMIQMLIRVVEAYERKQENGTITMDESALYIKYYEQLDELMFS